MDRVPNKASSLNVRRGSMVRHWAGLDSAANGRSELVLFKEQCSKKGDFGSLGNPKSKALRSSGSCDYVAVVSYR